MRSVARQDVECGLIDLLKIVQLVRVLAQKDSEGKMKQPSLCRLLDNRISNSIKYRNGKQR